MLLPIPRAKSVAIPTWFARNKMFSRCAGILFSRKARKRLLGCVAASENRYEVGGLLLGYRLWRLHYISGITVPRGADTGSIVSFTLDGPVHMEQAAAFPAPLFFKPSILGTWHSHICDGAHFSRQDQLANEAMAAELGGALAIVAFMPVDVPEFAATYITPKLTPVPCRFFFRH